MDTNLLEKVYAGKLRVRVCGICLQNNQLLLVRHKPFGQNKAGLWSPPGGGLLYGETLYHGLQREIKEETNLEVQVGNFLFVHEFISLPLHALELFFAVNVISGTLTRGFDPEFDQNNQLITEVAFKSLSEIQQVPESQLHHSLRHLSSFNDLYTRQFRSSGLETNLELGS